VLPALVSKVGGVNATLLTQAYQGFLYVDATNANNTLNYQTMNGGGGPAAVVYGGTGTIYSLTTDGANYYVSSDSGVYKGALNPPGPGAKINTGTALTLGWAKARLMAGGLNSLYVLDINGTPTTALPSPTYTHPNTAWRWTYFAECPAGIYVAGYTSAGGADSEVFFIGLTVTTGTPLLNAPVSVVPLPVGETVQCLYSYTGKFLGIGTNLGLRVGTINSDGTVTLGPLTLDGPTVRGPGLTLSVVSLAGNGRFMYALCNGTSPSYPSNLGAIRVDLGLQLEDARFAWAADMTSNSTSTATKMAFDTYGNLICGSSAGVLTPDVVGDTKAFLLSSRIRYSTADPKVFERIRVEALSPSSGDGKVKAYLKDASGVFTSSSAVATPSTGINFSEVRIEDSYSSKVAQYIQVEIDFTESTGKLGDITLASYVLKSLPAQKRQRLLAIPLMCYDNERDTAGNLIGGDATAFSRLRALESLEEAGIPVMYQRFNQAGVAVEQRTVVIDDVLFILRDQPNLQDSWGGIIMCTVRTVD
jgi:hypothetical protein